MVEAKPPVGGGAGGGSIGSFDPIQWLIGMAALFNPGTWSLGQSAPADLGSILAGKETSKDAHKEGDPIPGTSLMYAWNERLNRWGAMPFKRQPEGAGTGAGLETLPGFDWYGMLLRLGVPAATAIAVANSMGGEASSNKTTPGATGTATPPGGTGRSAGSKDTPTGDSSLASLPTWLKAVLGLGTAGAGIGAALAGGGNGGQINPLAAQPTWPALQSSFGDWLQSYFTSDNKLKGATPYPGQLRPELSQTLLPGVWNQYAQGNPGQAALQGILSGLNIGQYSPLTQQMMRTGGTGGLGNQAMLQFLQQKAPAYRAPTFPRF